MLAPKVLYGIITIDNKDASIALFEGDRFPQLAERLDSDDEGKGNPHFGVKKKMTAYYHGKTRKGGSKSAKIGRSIAGQSKTFMKRVADTAKRVFMSNGQVLPNMRGILVGGPGGTKYRFVNGKYLHPYLGGIVVAIEDVEFCDESGIRQLITKAADKLKDTQLIREMKLMNEFLERIATDKPVAYGKAEIEKALANKTAKILLLSDMLSSEEIQDYSRKAEKAEVCVEMISVDSEPGCQLWKSFRGIAALLINGNQESTSSRNVKND